MAEIKNPGNPVTEEHLANLERELGARLPMQYRQFLLKFNGGRPSPDVVDIEGLEGGETDVQVFFGIGRPIESSNLIWNKKWTSDRIPGRMLPVACDSGGSLFCLSLAGADFGKVIYVDLQFVGEPTQKVTFYMVAENFDAFLGKIRG